MFQKSRLVKRTRKLFKQIYKQSFSAIKKQIIWLLRTIFTTRTRRGSVNAGFVLPTVAMVAIVVVLLTTAILFRSFERSKNASNVRVNEIVLRAAAPALDRAKAKLEKLFLDPRLPRSTPSDYSLSQVINENINQYTFGDETQLKLVKDVNADGSITEDETLNSAWKYPVDTDNDGKFDSFTLYGIYFLTPTGTVTSTTNNGTTTYTINSRPRSSIEARTQPMDEGLSGSRCASNVATSADLVGSQGWYKVGSKLKRSIFVYTTTVPITNLQGVDNTNNKYEILTGNKGFSSLEYQQDRERIPLTNNAVIYENDLEIAPGAGIRINGRVFTNGNLLTRNSVRFYLVSSPYSCYHTQDNNKIVVAGNVINSKINENSANGGTVQVDFFKDVKPYSSNTPNSANIDDTNKTVPTAVYGNTGGFNDAAYAQRIKRLVDATNSLYPGTASTSASPSSSLPDEVIKGIESAMAADSTLLESDVQTQELTKYFRKRTRRVPYAEVGVGGDALKKTTTPTYDYTSTSPLQGSGNSLRPVDVWVFPFDPTDGKTETNYGQIGIKLQNTTTKLQLAATDPATLKTLTPIEEQRIGDRLWVGNNLPQYWYNSTTSTFVSSETGQNISGIQWDNNTNTRQRFTQANLLDDLGETQRDGFWEKAASQKPTGPLDVVGGLRVITGAGIYLPNTYTDGGGASQFSTAVASTATSIVWSDSMAMGVTKQISDTTNPTQAGLPKSDTPYLRMRATAVYHYKDSPYDPNTPATYQTPIACVSSYYDPTNSTTAKNKSGLPDFTPFPASGRALTGLSTIAAGNGGNSHNGVVYSASSLSTSGYTAALNYQASLKYPNGRWVNQPLKNALAKIAASQNLTLSEQSAVDSAMCALKIFDGTLSTADDSLIPHGAIMETAFLDARQVKAIDKPYSSSATNYDLDVELRQPLEIRTTILNLDLLRRKSKTGGEFLFPNSGIIYATRDDALPDLSSTSTPNSATSTDLDISSKDFKVDPTRRPNGIMLINGSNISRNSTYVAAEKGLILASNLPVYIRGNFNQHTKQEFSDITLSGTDWSQFYARNTLDPNFACRVGQFSTCTTGESWRPATVLADAITVLSSNFQLGYRNDGDYGLNDNYGNYPVGYDFNGDTTINAATTVTLDETAIKFDVNGDGDMADTTVSTIDETVLKADINGDGDMADTSVAINESNITATVAARLNGFWDNDFVTSRKFTDSNYSSSRTGAGSSYFNNFVTPIQRRATFAEYVMEICRKPTMTACKPNDWVVGYDLNDNGTWDSGEQDIKANALITTSNSNDTNAYSADPVSATNTSETRFGAGTTAKAAMLDADRLYPRRVAFLRDTNNNLRLFGSNPVAIGISSTGKVNYYPRGSDQTIGTKTYSAYSSSDATKRPRTQSNALWFRTDNAANNYDPKYPLSILNVSRLTGTRATEQPLLVPVLQIQYPTTSPSDTATLSDNGDNTKNSSGWFQIATATETNVVFAQGDTPGRPSTSGNTGETGGGLENFIRFLENWQGINLTASGSFIQFKRSSYATAPWQVFTLNYTDSDTIGYAPAATIFQYPQGYRVTTTQASGASMGRTPFYLPANRAWGYDVALLTQLPDLFSQRFTAPTLNPPNEFYREVPRDDNWVKTLLCAAQYDDPSDSITVGYNNAATNYGTNYKYAVSSDQRPSCP